MGNAKRTVRKATNDMWSGDTVRWGGVNSTKGEAGILTEKEIKTVRDCLVTVH